MCMFFHVASSSQRIKRNSISTPYSASASPPNHAELAKVGLGSYPPRPINRGGRGHVFSHRRIASLSLRKITQLRDFVLLALTCLRAPAMKSVNGSTTERIEL